MTRFDNLVKYVDAAGATIIVQPRESGDGVRVIIHDGDQCGLVHFSSRNWTAFLHKAMSVDQSNASPLYLRYPNTTCSRCGLPEHQFKACEHEDCHLRVTS